MQDFQRKSAKYLAKCDKSIHNSFHNSLSQSHKKTGKGNQDIIDVGDYLQTKKADRRFSAGDYGKRP